MFETKYFYQNDPKWRDVPLGNQSVETIGSWGCLLTSMTMILVSAGYDETPVTVNQKMKASGGFQGALIIPAVLPVLWPNVVYRGFDPCENIPAPLDRIDEQLAKGRPVIAQVDWNPDAGIQTHWILLKERKGNDYLMYDPYRYRGDNPDKELLVTQRYKYQGTNIAAVISGVVWFDIVGKQAPPDKERIPVPVNALSAFVAEDDLALRADPTIRSYLIRRLLADTELVCLEPRDIANNKIGKMNEWVHVQTPEGEQGYSAAWYLYTKNGDSTPEPTTTTTTDVTIEPDKQPVSKSIEAGPEDMIIMPTTDGLAFRSQPKVVPETQIRRVPESEQFLVIEDTDQARDKVGVHGQWLNVRDSEGIEGYVAAWYVKISKNPAMTGEQPAKPADEPSSTVSLKVKTAVDAVAIRNQPFISDATLIMYLQKGVVLDVIEPGGEAKIGIHNQWLKVRGSQGTEGYIAAWFVEKLEENADG